MKQKNNENKPVENSEKIYTIWDIDSLPKQKKQVEANQSSHTGISFFKRFTALLHG